MWVLLSSRLRAWALFAVAVPIVRFFLHRFSQSAQDTRPGARSTAALTRADSTLASFANRRSRRKASKRRKTP